MTTPNYHQKAVWSLAVALALLLGISSRPAAAQTYVEPTSPLGGTTAWPLNSSSNTQYKTGSLLIGPKSTCDQATGTGCAYICLNSDSDADASKCIKSWTDITGSNYVTLSTLTPVSTALSAHIVAAGRTADVGFARIRADSTKNQMFSLIVEANSSATSPAVGLYANDGGNLNNYAAQFVGRTMIGNNSSSYALCLNGEYSVVTNQGINYGRGCITKWSDLAAFAPPGNYVTLQTLSAIPSPQSGQIAISGPAALATSQGAVVIGAPSATTPVALTCGDSICDGQETEANCQADCDRTPPENIYSVEVDSSSRLATSYSVVLRWTNPTDADYVGMRIIQADTTPSGPDTLIYTKAINLPKILTFYTVSNLEYGRTYYFGMYTYDLRKNYSAGRTFSFIVNSETSYPTHLYLEWPHETPYVDPNI
jgi:hypothetical protein